MKVAIVCDWLVTYAGAERVLEEMLRVFPEADVFSVVDFLPEGERAFLGGRRPRTTFLQSLPGARRHYRTLLPLMPLAVEQLDVTGYDLVLSSSHAVAKGVLTGPDQLHISYVHSPMRYAWDLTHAYLRESGMTHGPKSWLARAALHYLRLWDMRTANGVDGFLANSRFIARRIYKCYRRRAQVLYPPVAVDRFPFRREKDGYYLTASRLVPYKQVRLLAAAFSRMPERELVIIGDGPEMAGVRAAAGANVRVLGYQPDEVLARYLAGARAFVYAAEEDFGILPVEAQACGTPVIAYGRGGLRDTVRPPGAERPTGLFFEEQSTAAVCAAVDAFEHAGGGIRAEDCRANAERFRPEVFRAGLRSYVERLLEKKKRELER